MHILLKHYEIQFEVVERRMLNIFLFYQVASHGRLCAYRYIINVLIFQLEGKTPIRIEQAWILNGWDTCILIFDCSN